MSVDYGMLKAKCKVHIAKDEVFLGPGIVKVFCEVNDAGSVKEAARRTGISYSKIWNIIKRAEKETGVELVSRHRGGTDGGTAHITPECEKLIGMYNELSDSVNEYAEKEFERIFADRKKLAKMTQD